MTEYINYEAIIQTQLKAQEDLKALTETVRHACKLIEGPAYACEGIIKEARECLLKAIGQEPDLSKHQVPAKEWTDYVGE